MTKYMEILAKKLIPFLILSVLLSASPSYAAEKSDASLLSIQENQAMRELVVLDSSIAYYQKNKANTSKEIINISKYTSAIERKLKVKEQSISKKRKVLNKRVQSIYKEGKTSFLEVLVKTKSLSEMLSKLGFFEFVANSDAKLIRQIEDQEVQLKNLKRNLNIKIADLSRLQIENEVNYNKLVFKSKSKKQYMEELKNKRLKLGVIGNEVLKVRKKMQVLGQSNRPKGKQIKVLVTGYGSNCSDCGTNGRTSTGMKAGRGIAAVSANPSLRIVPLGTKIYVPGYGKAVVADIGGGVASNQVDLCFETHAQAMNWGKKWLTITVMD